MRHTNLKTSPLAEANGKTQGRNAKRNTPPGEETENIPPGDGYVPPHLPGARNVLSEINYDEVEDIPASQVRGNVFLKENDMASLQAAWRQSSLLLNSSPSKYRVLSL